jgi:hypothetical protein
VKNPDILQTKETHNFVRVPSICWATGSAASFIVAALQLTLIINNHFFQSKYWFTTGNTFTAL